MGEPLFVSQAKLEAWVDRGDVTFEDDILTILAKNASYRLEAAVRITSLLDGDDTPGLVGRTLTIAQLGDLGAEHFADSVILGETAYGCDEGFVGNRQGGKGPGDAPSVPAVGPTVTTLPSPAALPESPSAAEAPVTEISPPPEGMEPAQDVDLLTDFLLKNL